LNGTERGEYSALKKIHVMCKTCGVSESFYSNLSVERFKSNHSGHDVDGGGGQGMPSEAHEVESAPREEELLESEAGMRLAKVVVDLIVFPALPNPVFRVRGFRDNVEAFISTSPFEQRAKVREMLASGDYVDQDFSGLRYVWEPDVIEYEGEARAKLGLPVEKAKEERTAEPEVEPRESPRNLDESTVASTNQVLFADFRRVGPGQTSAQLVSVPPPQHEEFEVPAPPSPPRPTQDPPPEHELMETPAARQPPAAKSEVKIEEKIEEKNAVETASKVVAAPSREETDDGGLLVSKSWYIQGGTGNRKEAARISEVLKSFRWKVEPVYTIGVILDDILSIETSKNQISRTLINCVENAGYRLTAVTMDQGKPVAWFKKAVSVPEEPAANDSGVSSLDDVEAELEADVAA
jgi:hypothetical protein